MSQTTVTYLANINLASLHSLCSFRFANLAPLKGARQSIWPRLTAIALGVIIEPRCSVIAEPTTSHRMGLDTIVKQKNDDGTK